MDPGAITENKIYEKKITFDTAKIIAMVLEKSGRYKVHLTRDGDYFVPLRERYKIAENLHADFFISIHADSIDDKNLRGATVYTLSEKASDKEADALAKSENLSDIYAGQVYAQASDDIKKILIDLGQRNTKQESSKLSKYILEGFQKAKIETLPTSHRFAGFQVLKSPIVPSVLLELGFLSNKEQAALLQKPEHQQLIAQEMVKALDSYFAGQKK